MKVKVYEGGYTPTRAHFDDAGIDFYSPDDFTIPAKGAYLIDLKVAVELPIGTFGKMESKSGLMTQRGVVCAGGIIDSGFRGTIKVRMENHGDAPYTFRKGEKVTQMVIIPVLLATIDDVDNAELDPADSGRNKSGWGSTGKR